MDPPVRETPPGLVEERYRTIFSYTRDPVYIADIDTLEVLEVNGAFLELLGYDALPPGFLVYDLVAHDPASVDRFREAIRDEGRVMIGERNWRRRDGSAVAVEVHAMQVPYHGRNCYCIIAHDVSERKKHAAELRRRNRRLSVARRIDREVARNPDLAALAGTLAAAFKPFGPIASIAVVALAEGREADPLSFWPADSPPAICGGEAAAEAVARRVAASGAPGDWKVHVPLCLAAAPFAVVCLRAGGRRPMGAETLIILELVAPQIAAAVAHGLAAREREEIARAKAEFVAIASHELRTPLSVVKGYARLLLAPGFAADEAERQAYLQRMYDGCDRLSRLADDLLDAARADEGKVRTRAEPIRVATVLAHAARVLTDRYGQAPVLPEGDRQVAGDPQALERVLVNLLDNAYKYSESGSPPDIHWRGDPDAPRQGLVVSNDGPALSAEDLGRLFQRFGRLPRHAARPGTGLGLYTARALIEHMGGEMGVESAAGRIGFWFELPTARQASADGVPKESSPAG
ncbi:MAG: PAS domain S-box protein [Candidatus Sericytochromatia bacterium]|nr:PAS domain S-box protein [Candidatus Tanganyikabacteria bacterium]